MASVSSAGIPSAEVSRAASSTRNPPVVDPLACNYRIGRVVRRSTTIR